MNVRPVPVGETGRRRAPGSGERPTRPLAARLLRRYVPAFLLLVALMVGWELLARLGPYEQYVLPAPSEVAKEGYTERDLLAGAGWVTAKEVGLGLALAVAAGLALAVLLHASGVLRQAVYPLLIGSQTVPVVVLAPILVMAFGFGTAPKVVIVALTCFFPVVVNAVDGLGSVDPDLPRLMRTLDAGRVATFRRVEFPAALPQLFTGLRIAAVYAPIGAVFGEWSGSTDGLGYLMLQATPQLRAPLVFACIAVLSAISVGLFLAVSLVERLVAPWKRR